MSLSSLEASSKDLETVAPCREIGRSTTPVADTKPLDRVVVNAVQDNYASPVEPSDSLAFSTYGLIDFAIQGWDGTTCLTLATVTGNNLVKRTVPFNTFTTDRIRVNATNGAGGFSRITEVEAWGN